MKEKIRMHIQIEAENKRKFEIWKRFEIAEKILGFRPENEDELLMYESNGFDDSILAYR